MPLVIRDDGDIFRPIPVCDYCNEDITDVEDGNYQWPMRDVPGGDMPIYFTHKRCCHPFEQTHRLVGGPWGAEELKFLLVYLANNTRFSWKKAGAFRSR